MSCSHTDTPLRLLLRVVPSLREVKICSKYSTNNVGRHCVTHYGNLTQSPHVWAPSSAKSLLQALLLTYSTSRPLPYVRRMRSAISKGRCRLLSCRCAALPFVSPMASLALRRPPLASPVRPRKIFLVRSGFMLAGSTLPSSTLLLLSSKLQVRMECPPGFVSLVSQTAPSNGRRVF